MSVSIEKFFRFESLGADLALVSILFVNVGVVFFEKLFEFEVFRTNLTSKLFPFLDSVEFIVDVTFVR